MIRSTWSALLLSLCIFVVTLTGCSSSSDEPRLGETTQALSAGPVISSFSPSSGAEGTAIALTGTGFTGATKVSFGGTSAPSFSVTSDSSLSVTVPSGALTGTIAVTTALGTGTSKSSFKIRPTIGSFAPTSGGPGTVVIVNGTGLLGATAVTIAGTAASFIVVGDTELDATVAPGTGNGKVVVTAPGGAVTSTQLYAASGPTITTFSAQAKQGATVTINGTGFANVSAITFGGVPSTSTTTVSESQVKAVVPSGALTGPLVVTTILGSATTTTSFDVTPTIASFSPTNGAPGDLVDILGTGLTQATSVAFGAASTSTVTHVSDTEIKAKVPAAATTGKLAVTTAGGTSASSGTFTIQSVPVLTSFSPASAAQGATVTITGTNMLGANAVTFDGVAATISSSSATAVKAIVPAGATTGFVTVSNEAGTGTSPTTYPILPKITSFTPTSGLVGATVTISGSAFSGATAVTFGAVSTAYSAGSDTTISALVPPGVTSGKITVTTAGGVATSSATFQVLSPPTITSFSPTSASAGSTITIRGAAFTGATSVSFGGAAAASFQVTSSTVISAVVPTNASTGPITVVTPVGSATSASSLTLPANKCAGVVCSALDACHVVGTCNVATGTCSNPIAANGASCNDGNACTQSDTCQAGVCSGANPIACAASDACHVAGSCDAATGACSNPPAPNGTACSDGNACTRSDSCQSGVCSGSSPVTCSAIDSCHVAGACNPSTGACTNPTATDGTACNDNNACTQSDACHAGVCGGAAVTCAASDACHVAGTCSPATGCSNPVAADGASCSDGNPCNGAETCSKGACTAGPPPNPSCAGGSSQPLPPPPVAMSTAPATSTVGGIDVIDPNNVLPGGVTVTTVAGAAADLLGADAVYQIGPAGALPQIIDLRFRLSAAVPPGTVALFWTRSGTSGPFFLQSIGRIDPTGALASFQVSQLGQVAITLLGNGGGFLTDGSPSGTRFLGIAPQDGAAGFITLGGNLSVTNAGRIAVGSPGIQRPRDGLPTLATGAEHWAGANAVFEISPGLIDVFGQSVDATQAAASGDIVVQGLDGTLSFNRSVFASNAYQASISADGKTVTYTNSDAQVAYGITSPQILSVAPDGTPSNLGSGQSVVAKGGRWVAFESYSTNLDPLDPTPGVYFRDLTKPGLQHLAYAHPTVYVADCRATCATTPGCTVDASEVDGGCLAGQVPFAISDGGRYVFLKDDIASEPIPPRTTTLPHAFTYSGAPCVNAYRLDRLTGLLEAVAYGDWFGVDRGGRTIVSHQCYENDVVQNDDAGIFFSPLTVRDMAVGASAAVPLTAYAASALNQLYGFDASFMYQWGLVAAGNLAGDGNSVFYVLDGFNSEQYTWEAWSNGVPSLVASPIISLGTVVEYKPITVTYSGMPNQNLGDMFVLVDASGNAINAYPTNGGASGSFQIAALPPATYYLDAYASLTGDPNILKRLSRTPIPLAPPTPTLTLPSPLCEFTAFDVQFSNLLAVTQNDHIDFGSVDGLGNFTLIDSQSANGAGSGTVHFADNVTAGDSSPASYALRVYYGTPDGSASQLASTTPLSFTVCPATLGTSSTSFRDQCLSAIGPTSENPTTTQGISRDGRFVVYVSPQRDLHLLDRQSGMDQVVVSKVASFGVSTDAMHFAYMFDAQPQIHVVATVDLTETLVPVTASLPFYAGSIHLSLDAKTVATQVTVQSGGFVFQHIEAVRQAGAGWAPILTPTMAPGCFPSLTDDGQVLVFQTETSALKGCDNYDQEEYRPVVIGLAAPSAQSACPPPGAIETGQIDLGNGTPLFEAPILSAQISPDGSRLAFMSWFDPYGVSWPMQNPPSSAAPYGSFAFTQNLDGSGRFYFGAAPFPIYLDGGGNLFFATYGSNVLYRQAPGGSPTAVANVAGLTSMFVSPSPTHRMLTSGVSLTVQAY